MDEGDFMLTQIKDKALLSQNQKKDKILRETDLTFSSVGSTDQTE